MCRYELGLSNMCKVPHQQRLCSSSHFNPSLPDGTPHLRRQHPAESREEVRPPQCRRIPHVPILHQGVHVRFSQRRILVMCIRYSALASHTETGRYPGCSDLCFQYGSTAVVTSGFRHAQAAGSTMTYVDANLPYQQQCAYAVTCSASNAKPRKAATLGPCHLRSRHAIGWGRLVATTTMLPDLQQNPAV